MNWLPKFFWPLFFVGLFGFVPVVAVPDATGRIIEVGPADYLTALGNLKAGDTLRLAPGEYDDPQGVPGLPLFDLHGEPGRPIVIEGPREGPKARLLARSSHNTVRIARASHVIIRYLELDGRNADVDAVKAQGSSHHITIEHLRIVNHGNNQQTVAISTKAPAWDWIIRHNTIVRPGTGLYLGNSDGAAPFVRGTIEHNLIVDPVGYAMEIKHQRSRPADIGLPQVPAVTTIRHNVFAKVKNAARGGAARPNLLVGHFPVQGAGRDDRYEIYGNFLYENAAGECLFQGEGNVAFYSNVLVNSHGGGVCIRPHNDRPRDIAVFNNTILAQTTGIRIVGLASGGSSLVVGNLVFAGRPLDVPTQQRNLTGTLDEAARYLVGPLPNLPGFDARLRFGLEIVRSHPEETGRFQDAGRDFGGSLRGRNDIGAYVLDGGMYWPLALEIKPERSRIDPSTRGNH